MTEDPLERIEREEREKKERNNGLKTTTVILALVAVALGGALAWTMMKNRGMVRELETDKAELTEQVMAFRDSLSTMHSNYDGINAQLLYLLDILTEKHAPALRNSEYPAH